MRKIVLFVICLWVLFSVSTAFAATEYRPRYREGFGVVVHELESKCQGPLWILAHQFSDFDFATVEPFYFSDDSVFATIHWNNGYSRYEPQAYELEYHKWTKKHKDVSWHIPELWRHESIYGNCPACNDHDISIRLKGDEKQDRWAYDFTYQCGSCGYSETWRWRG